MCCHTVSLSQEGLKALSAPRQTKDKVLPTEWGAESEVVSSRNAKKRAQK